MKFYNFSHKAKRLDHEGMQKVALRLYLEEHKNTLSGIESSCESFNAEVIIDEIVHIFQSLNYSTSFKNQTFFKTQCSKLTQVSRM